MMECNSSDLFCRQCGHQVFEDQKRCSMCGILQPYSGFRISAEGGKPPFNGFAIFGFGLAVGAYIVSLHGLTALGGLVLSIVGLVGAKRKGQGGSKLAIAGIIIATISILIKLVAIGILLWFTDALYDEFVASPNWIEEHPFWGFIFSD